MASIIAPCIFPSVTADVTDTLAFTGVTAVVGDTVGTDVVFTSGVVWVHPAIRTTATKTREIIAKVNVLDRFIISIILTFDRSLCKINSFNFVKYPCRSLRKTERNFWIYCFPHRFIHWPRYRTIRRIKIQITDTLVYNPPLIRFITIEGHT